MKKIILTGLVLILGMQSFAQNKKEEEKKRKVHRVSKLQLGIRSGLNLSFLNGNGIIRDKNRVAYHFGVYGQMPIPKKSKDFLLEVGVLYSLKGYDKAKLVGDDNYTVLGSEVSLTNKDKYSSQSNLKVTYLDIPIVIKDNQSEKFSPYGGFQFSTVLNSSFEYAYKLDKDTDWNVRTSTNKDNFKTLQFGVILGLEYHVNHFLNLNVSYVYPMSMIDKKSESEIKMNDLKLGIGFTF